MTPPEIARTLKLRLASELADEQASLVELARSLASLLAPAADPRDEWMRTLALAFQLERRYTAVEAMLSRVPRALDGDVSTGATWHRERLRASSVGIEGGRPPVIGDTLAELQGLLKFRHLVRLGY
jgi:hypothetical protein